MTTLEGVMSFIAEADESDLEAIADELTDRGVDFRCSECEDHECDCECEEDDEYAKKQFISELIDRGNRFGIQELLSELRQEGERIGAYLTVHGGTS